jgi:hypothetical protein
MLYEILPKSQIRVGTSLVIASEPHPPRSSAPSPDFRRGPGRGSQTPLFFRKKRGWGRGSSIALWVQDLPLHFETFPWYITPMHPQIQKRIANISQKEPVSWHPVERGYTPAQRWVIQFSDGSSAFAKIGTTPLTANWLRAEYKWYSALSGNFLPKVYGFEDDPEQPILLLEDLSRAYWPPPWRPGDIELLQKTLHQIASTRPLPAGITSLQEIRGFLRGWDKIALDPEAFLSLGFCTKAWLDHALPILREAENKAQVDGNDLLHSDVRSDNLCILGGRMVFVDWNNPLRGNALFDLAAIAPSLRLEGGPLPEELLPNQPYLAAAVCGYFAANAGLPIIPNAPKVRWIQLRQLRMALPWTVRALQLPPLDVRWGQNESLRIEQDFAQGKIDEAAWYQENEELIGDAYLAVADPRAQSGKSGDEDEWRWSRELALDAIPEGGSVLDVGCANGYLMESFHRWGQERGVNIEPYGLDISWRLASLAQRRLPHWSERIFVGNVLEWVPTRRFTMVHTAFDYVTPNKQKKMIERIQRDFLVDGGKITLRAERVKDGVPDLVVQVEAIGVKVGGVIEAKHPSTGELRRTVWI